MTSWLRAMATGMIACVRPVLRTWSCLWVLLALGFGATVTQSQTVSAPVVASASEPASAAAAESPATVSLQRQFLADNPTAQLFDLALVSEAYREDPSNPAIELRRMWVGESGTLLELRGLSRRGQRYSALISPDTLRLVSPRTKQAQVALADEGGLRFEERDGRKLIRLAPDDLLYLFFGPIQSLDAHGLAYTNAQGRDDSYIDRIDPRFRERYDQMHAQASRNGASVEEMKDFLLGFVSQDPDGRIQKIFVALIGKLRSLKTFDGHYQAYRLVKDPVDEREARKLVQSEEQRAKLDEALAQAQQAEALKREEKRRAEEARLAELRKRDEARQADLRRQEDVRLAEQRAAQAQANEQRCLQDAACRRAFQERQAQCGEKVAACRSGCDRLTGSGSYGSFISNLVAAGMARTCYVGCKCDSGFGDLLDKFNNIAAGTPTSRSGSTVSGRGSTPTDAKASERSSEANKAGTPKTFECKIYCKTSNGPTVFRRFEAATRREAAKLAGERANEVCAAEGQSHASSVALPESQCSQK